MKLPSYAPGILILTGALFALRAGPALAQGSKAPVPDLVLAWKPGAGGDSLVLAVKITLPPGWYVNSHAPLDSFLVPTRVEAAAARGFAGPLLEFDPPRYPPAIVEHSQALAGDMSLFKGAFEITLTARGPAKGKARAALPHPPPPVHVTLHYQSCDGNMCWPPKAVSARLVDGTTRRE